VGAVTRLLKRSRASSISPRAHQAANVTASWESRERRRDTSTRRGACGGWARAVDRRLRCAITIEAFRGDFGAVYSLPHRQKLLTGRSPRVRWRRYLYVTVSSSEGAFVRTEVDARADGSGEGIQTTVLLGACPPELYEPCRPP